MLCTGGHMLGDFVPVIVIHVQSLQTQRRRGEKTQHRRGEKAQRRRGEKA